jgi:hypothetical protein
MQARALWTTKPPRGRLGGDSPGQLPPGDTKNAVLGIQVNLGGSDYVYTPTD